MYIEFYKISSPCFDVLVVKTVLPGSWSYVPTGAQCLGFGIKKLLLTVYAIKKTMVWVWSVTYGTVYVSINMFPLFR